MQIGFVGLGRMGGNMAHRLIRDGGHTVVGYATDDASLQRARDVGADTVDSLQALVGALQAPRAVWAMVPAGDATEGVIETLLGLLQPGDTIVDGGNSNYHDTMRRAERCAERGVHLVDAGTSGGIWGLQVGYCLMVGGDPEPVERLRPIFETLAPPDGFLHVGPVGSGHYVKMVHNGVEYGMLQAYAEGFHILHESRFPVDLHAVAKLWNHGSVVRSWLLELAESAFERDPTLAGLRGWVDDSGEGRWTAHEAIDLGVPAPVVSLSLMARFQSRQPDGFGNRVIAALRNEFGGHAVHGAEATTD